MPYKYGGAKRKKDEGKSVRGLLGNLVDDVVEAGAGLVPGIINVGKSVVHDAGVSTGLASGPFQSDDILGAIRRSYTDKGTFWGELGRGHVGRAGHALYNAPLGPVLDVATVFTGGGAAAGKLGATLAKGGSAKGAALAGLDPLTLAPRRYTIANTTGGSFTKPVRRNATVRGRQDLFEAASARFPDAPVIGANKRVGRHEDRLEKRAKADDVAKVQSRYRLALRKLSRKERDAMWLAAGSHTADSADAFYSKRLAMVDAEISRKESGAPDGETFDQVDPLELGAGQAAKGAAPNPDAGTDVVLWQAPNGEPRIHKPRVDEEIALRNPDPDDFSDLMKADRNESLRRNRRNRAFLQTRLAKVRAVQASGVLDNPSPRLLEAVEAVREMSDNGNRRIADLSMGPDADADALKDIAGRQANRSSLESRIMREVGAVDQVYSGAIRSHQRVVKDKLDTNGPNGFNRFEKPGRMSHDEYNSGYNWWNGRDSTNPAIYLQTASNIAEQASRITRHARMLDLGMLVSRMEAGKMEDSGKYRIVETDTRLRKDMAEVYDILVDAEAVMAGTPGYNVLRKGLERSLPEADGTEEFVFVLPTKTYDEMAGEFQRSSDFIRRWVDGPTKLWRNMTLNLRPAWIVNNFVGQLMLLANAYGVRGLKNYIVHGSKLTKRGRWVEETTPSLTAGWASDADGLKGVGQSWAHDPESALKRGASKFVTGPVKFSQAMGDLNTWLTDAPQRRGALISAIDPHVRKFQKAHPDMTWEEAATKLWENDEFSNEMTQRVLDDLVDFTDLSKVERNIVKRAIPFYSWIKGASKVGANTVLNKPWNAAGGAAVANVAIADVKEQFGEDVSPFMYGLANGPGATAFATQALNPAMTPVDIAAMIAGTFLPNGNRGSQNPLSQLSPVFKPVGESLARRDFFFGSELDPQGEQSFTDLYKQQAAKSFAQKRLLDAIRNPNNDNPNRVYDQSTANAVANYLGLPIRTLAEHHRG